jgi:hypothetical protein
MGLLDGDLVPVVGAAFGWLLLPGLLHRRALEPNGKGGFVSDGFAAPPEPVKVMVDGADDVIRAVAGFKDTDVKLLILAYNSDTGQGVAKPGIDDEVTVQTGKHAGRYHVLPPLAVDAAGTHYTSRGRRL